MTTSLSKIITNNIINKLIMLFVKLEVVHFILLKEAVDL